jgi:hypothetical protein
MRLVRNILKKIKNMADGIGSPRRAWQEPESRCPTNGLPPRLKTSLTVS